MTTAVIWSKTGCPHCEQAKLMFDIKGIQYEEKKLEVNATREELLEAVPNAQSVPQIFLNGEFVGGVKELRERLKNVD